MSQVLTGISSIPISAASAGYAPTNTGEVGDMIGSAVSGLASTADLSAYLATSSIGVDSASAITSIAGSSLAGGGATGDYVPTSADSVAIGSGNTASGGGFIHGFRNYAVGCSLVQGTDNRALDESFAQGNLNSAREDSFAQGDRNSADNRSFAQGHKNSVINDSFTQGSLNSAYNTSFAQGYNVSASATAAVFGQFNLDGQGSGTSGIALAFGDGTATTAKHNLFEFRKDGTLTLYSSTADTTGLEVRSALNSKLDSSASSAFLTSQVNASWSETASSSPAFIVDKPDLVAGPGIAIDNPYGNTIRVSVDETVLSTTSYNMSNNPTITLSEPAWNFEYVDIYALPHSTNTIPVVIRFATAGLVSNNKGSITVQAHAGGGGIRLNNALVIITSAGNIQIIESGQFSIIGTTVSSGTAASVFTKVVGINRIASA